jgi:hypothetical protein
MCTWIYFLNFQNSWTFLAPSMVPKASFQTFLIASMFPKYSFHNYQTLLIVLQELVHFWNLFIHFNLHHRLRNVFFSQNQIDLSPWSFYLLSHIEKCFCHKTLDFSLHSLQPLSRTIEKHSFHKTTQISLLLVFNLCHTLRIVLLTKPHIYPLAHFTFIIH